MERITTLLGQDGEFSNVKTLGACTLLLSLKGITTILIIINSKQNLQVPILYTRLQHDLK